MRGMRDGLLEELLVLGIVEQATSVVEQHPQRDGLAVGHPSGQPVLHGVVEREPPFMDELEDHRGNEASRSPRKWSSSWPACRMTRLFAWRLVPARARPPA